MGHGARVKGQGVREQSSGRERWRAIKRTRHDASALFYSGAREGRSKSHIPFGQIILLVKYSYSSTGAPGDSALGREKAAATLSHPVISGTCCSGLPRGCNSALQASAPSFRPPISGTCRPGSPAPPPASSRPSSSAPRAATCGFVPPPSRAPAPPAPPSLADEAKLESMDESDMFCAGLSAPACRGG